MERADEVESGRRDCEHGSVGYLRGALYEHRHLGSIL